MESQVKTSTNFDFPGLGRFDYDCGLVELAATSDGLFTACAGGVQQIAATGDGKVEFVAFAESSLAHVRSALGYPAYYPVQPVELERPVKAVLMDLDGTSVHSESFWIWIIQSTTATLLDRPGFELEEADLPFVSGHSVSEHLQYCIDKYCPSASLEDARHAYFEHTHREMKLILDGKGRADAFRPTRGLKDFLLYLKSEGLMIGLVTSGLYEKAYPEIVAAFRTLGMGRPEDFYDAFITAGYPLRKGEVGTLGELSPKPHPWLYAEAARIGLGIPFEERCSVVGIEDSAAGVASVRLAGFPTLGLVGGNIIESGAQALTAGMFDTLEEIRQYLFS